MLAQVKGQHKHKDQQMNFHLVWSQISDQQNGQFAIGNVHIPPSAFALVATVEHSVTKLWGSGASDPPLIFRPKMGRPNTNANWGPLSSSTHKRRWK